MTDELSAHQPLDTDAVPDKGPGLRGIGLVALGGMAGTLGRYIVDGLIGTITGLPLGIFIINVTGAFALGVLIESLALGGPDRGRRRDLRLLLGTGLLGGYTTYSLLATDIADLLIDHQIAGAIAYGLATIIVGGLASWSGILAVHARRLRS